MCVWGGGRGGQERRSQTSSLLLHARTQIGSSVILIVRNPVTRVFSDYRMIHYKRQDVPDRIEELIFTSDGQVDKDEEIIIPSEGGGRGGRGRIRFTCAVPAIISRFHCNCF